MSCTGEYGAFLLMMPLLMLIKANIMAQMVITMTRVNGIYERELESRISLCLTILI
jgi:hypothetical protein